MTVANFLATENTATGKNTQIRIGTGSTTNNSGEYRFYNVGLGSLSNRLDFGFTGTDTRLSILAGGNVGVGTTDPKAKLHVNGSLQVTNEINLGGNATTAGSAGTAGQVLVSNGAGAAPTWKSNTTTSGTIAKAVYVQGTSEATTTSFGANGTPIDVPGVTFTHTVPAGASQTLLFTITGYAVRSGEIISGQAAQGVFTLLQGTTKVSSAYAASGDIGDLDHVPISTTLLKSVTLSPGTYTFKVQYKAWSDNQTVNFNPSSFIGYNGDTEAMLTKMQVLVYNN
ncbi:hypothetical protein FKX85_00865 [Echinicola soli]|uniref:Uncharacterized protein n=1 Tax=Echinicola soli TaxID=2591634 RepID=A0A514CCW9_9BACT|nr:hypothetical protein [Echinicola soli]QDH77672.1 hypothetical protein FKX85_00865 [Echinicola soli]